MNKLLRRWAAAGLALSWLATATVPAWAQTSAGTNLCQDTGVVFVFFNGVQTTPEEADTAKEELRRLYGDRSAQGDLIRYEVLYNYSNGFEDFVETFEQRLLEQDKLLEGRFELFFEALRGDGPWWSKIVSSVSSAAGILQGFVDQYKAAAISRLASLAGSAPTEVNYAEHRTRIDNWILEGKKLLFVAHSQGNLFANAAYQHALTKTGADSVKLVHIAPASPTLNGSHTLADLDLVINGLRAVGSVADTTDSIPGYLLRPAGLNGQKDILGHGLLEIYLNPSLAVSTRVSSHVNAALAALVAPPAQATSGFFTATLTWDGEGDVDLHTTEPGAAHVYYAAQQGGAGYLDVDNVVADGPEHYYASCDSSALQTGTYRIAVANYARAEGRKATVQIASWSDGVLGTKTVTLGADSGDVPGYTLFDVLVQKNAQTGQYSVTLSP